MPKIEKIQGKNSLKTKKDRNNIGCGLILSISLFECLGPYDFFSIGVTIMDWLSISNTLAKPAGIES